MAKRDDLIKAIDLALADEWDAAHAIVQQYEQDETAALVHGLLHSIEGDEANARYWFRRAHTSHENENPPQDQLRTLREKLVADH